MARQGLSANEVTGALISMMARSIASNQRPDTLMQDRLPPARRNLLATHGRTIHRVKAPLWPSRDSLELVEPVGLLFVSARNKLICRHLSKCRILLAPSN